MHVEPYLHFDGTCEEALAFYQTIFGGEIGEIARFGTSPMADHVPEEDHEAVMHTTYRAPGVSFMASDWPGGLPPAGIARVRLSVATPDLAEGERIFAALAANGTIHQQFMKTFWGATFGMVTDQYGIDWMINAG